MKRIAIAVLAIAAVIAAWILGPDLLDAWRFKQAMDGEKQAAAAEDARAHELSMTCNQCHGHDGNSQHDFYPSLAGQPQGYLFAQLDAFADGRRTTPQMQALALYLSAEDKQRISAYYATRSVVVTTSTATGEVPERLAQCKSCHGPALQGGTAPVLAPRLAGQGRQYLKRQLEAFRSGARRDATGAMTAVAKSLDQKDIDALAMALSAMPTPNSTRTASTR